MADRIEVQRKIAAPPADIFAVLCDPQGHVAIDSSGMLQDAEGASVAAAGDSGGSPRPELYFEIRKGGKPVDPRPWFKAPDP